MNETAQTIELTRPELIKRKVYKNGDLGVPILKGTWVTPVGIGQPRLRTASRFLSVSRYMRVKSHGKRVKK